MKSAPTDIKNSPIYISKDLKSSGQSKNKKERTSLLSVARNLFIETDNKGNHTALDKMRSMMGNDTTYRQMNIKRNFIVLLIFFIILYLVALVGSTILKIPLDSFYDKTFNYLFSGDAKIIEVILAFICIIIISIIYVYGRNKRK